MREFRRGAIATAVLVGWLMLGTLHAGDTE